MASTPNGQGFWLFDTSARVNTFGDATWHRSMEGTALAKPVVGADNYNNSGYWMFAADGGVFAFDAPYHNSLPGLGVTPACAVVDGKVPPTLNGYWMAGCDGGLFAFGGAQFHGSMGGSALACAITGMTHNPRTEPLTGKQGYWMVGCDGGVFNFGYAGFHGSMAGRLAAPASGIAATGSGNGYWIVGEDGGVFAFGDALYAGNLVGVPHARIISIEPHGSTGYWLLAEDGAVYAFGSAPYLGNGV